MDPSVFRAFRDIAFEQAGIRLGEGKEALVTARVGKRVRALRLGSEREYLERLSNDPSGEELVRFLDAIATNFTHFFREPDHFDWLAREALAAARRGTARLRYWCAAASSGEEPFTMAMVLAEALAGLAVDFRILATDLSTRVLERALAGEYTEKHLEPVPAALRKRYFEPAGHSSPDGPLLRAKPELVGRVLFKRLNLARPPFPMKGPLQAVFCRNVMIYLDRNVRQAFVEEAERLLCPGGLLIIGHSETLTGLKTGLRLAAPSVYRKAA